MGDMSEPRRVQLRRTKGWRKPDNTVVVARPSRWGNQYAFGTIRGLRNLADRYTFPDPNAIVVMRYGRHGHYDGTMYGGYQSLDEARYAAIDLFRRSLLAAFADVDGGLTRDYYLGELRGKNLGCWCPLDQPCHADVLLGLANDREAAIAPV
jgi:hypothetical protein